MKLQDSAELHKSAGRKMFMCPTHAWTIGRRILFIVVGWLSYGAAAAQMSDTLHLTDNCLQVNISKYCRQLPTGKGAASSAAVLYANDKLENTITPGPNGVRLRVVLHNASSSDRLFKLWLNNPGAQNATVELLKPVSVSLANAAVQKTVVLTSAERLASFPVFLRKGGLSTLYITIGIQEPPAIIMPVIIDAAEVRPYMLTDHAMIAIAGLLLCTIISSLIVTRWFPVADTAWLLALVINVTGYMLASSGIGSMYFWPAGFNNNAVIFFAAISGICFLELCRRLINASTRYPRLNNLLLVMVTAYGVATIARLAWQHSSRITTGYEYTKLVFDIISGIPLLVMLEVAIYNAVKKLERTYWWFAAAIICALISQALNVLWVRGIISYSVSAQFLMSSTRFIPQTMLLFVFLVQRLFTYSKQRNQEIAMMAATCLNCELYPETEKK